MSKHDLKNFEARLKDLMGGNNNLRPFVCEGSPLACQAFIIGLNPANKLDDPFWKFWDSDYGFRKSEWFEYYKQEKRSRPLAPGKTKRAAIGNTRRVIDWIVEEASPVRCLETNIHALATARAKDLPTEYRRTEIFDFLLKAIDPKVLLLHGKDAEQHIKEVSTSAQIIAVPHLAIGWSQINAKKLGRQIREACTAT